MAPLNPDERLAVVEQILKDIRGDVDELRRVQREDHHTLRGLGSTTEMLARAHEQAEKARDYQLRRVGIRIQWLSLAVALGGLAMGLGLALLAALR